MSFDPTSGGGYGGELEAALSQMFKLYFDGLQISSSGGDSPKTNRVTHIPDVAGFGALLDGAVRTAVLRHMEENGLISGPGGTSSQKGPQGKDPLSAIGTAQSALSSPAEFLLSQAERMVPILVPLLVVAMAPKLIETAIDLMTAPGMPLDPRWKRAIQKEVFGILSRQQQENSRIGLRNVSIQSHEGFIMTNGGASQSLLQQVKDGTGPSVGTTVIGTQFRAEGVK
jgi:hypothetical protein